MLKGYEDDGPRVRLCHFPMRMLLGARRVRRMDEPRKDLNWGKGVTGSGAIRFPYTTRSENGWDPFRRDQKRISRLPR